MVPLGGVDMLHARVVGQLVFGLKHIILGQRVSGRFDACCVTGQTLGGGKAPVPDGGQFALATSFCTIHVGIYQLQSEPIVPVISRFVHLGVDMPSIG